MGLTLIEYTYFYLLYAGTLGGFLYEQSHSDVLLVKVLIKNNLHLFLLLNKSLGLYFLCYIIAQLYLGCYAAL